MRRVLIVVVLIVAAAEVFVRRTADSPTSLRRREIIIEQTSDGILVRSKQSHVGLWEHLFGKDPNEEVTIKAPRQIALSLRGVNGRVNVTDIDGSIEVRLCARKFLK